mmetsp:Transcript_4409/g.10650  ORF Transcript_4409/g.10650 Transcript_4409/m.10650 type:complete len:890 (-) Transcript_4409:3339-6008(-)
MTAITTATAAAKIADISRLLISFHAFLIAFVVIANGFEGCSSFQLRAPPAHVLPRASIADLSASKFRFTTYPGDTKLFSSEVLPSEEELLAAVESGSLDIEDLKEMFGADFDFDNEEEEDEEEEDEEEMEDELLGEYQEFNYDLQSNEEMDGEAEEEGCETELLMNFVGHCRETPIGELEIGDAELIREVLRNFPLDAVDVEEDDNIENHDDDDASMRASYVVESLFHRFVDEWKDSISVLEGDDEDVVSDVQEREQLFRPISSDFYHVMLAVWTDKQSRDSLDTKAKRIWNLLSEQRELISFFKDVDDFVTAETLYPTLRAVEVVMESLFLSSDRNVDAKASALVEEWLPEYGLAPSPKVYGTYIQMAAKARHRGAARRAEKILKKAVREYPPNDYESPIGVEVFNAVVTAYAKARGESKGPERAQDLIVFMDTLGKPGCAPNAKTFTSLVDAYAQTNEWDGVSEAQSILNNLLNQYLDDGQGKHLEPSVATWTIVIAAWMRLSRKGRTGAAKRAGDLLRRMESLSSAGRITAKPDAITYVTVFNAYANSKFKDEIEKAEELLDEMNETYLDGDDSFKPSVPSIKTLLKAWIKVGDVFHAEKILKKYEGFLEDAENDESGELRNSMSASDWEEIYKSLLNGHTRFDNPRRATECLHLMIENDDMEPDGLCYEKIIETYARLGEEDFGQKTQELFQLMEKRRELGMLSPNERVYTCVIRALTKAEVPGLHKKAHLVLQRMRSLANEGNPKVEPNVFTYNAVLNACAKCVNIDSIPNAEAFQTAVRVVTELREAVTPDHVTFANMINCSNLLSTDSQQKTKDKFITTTFKLCCESSNVNNFFIRDLSRAASVDLWVGLTRFSPDSKERAAIDVEEASRLVAELPPAWTRQ